MYSVVQIALLIFSHEDTAKCHKKAERPTFCRRLIFLENLICLVILQECVTAVMALMRLEAYSEQFVGTHVRMIYCRTKKLL